MTGSTFLLLLFLLAVAWLAATGRLFRVTDVIFGTNLAGNAGK